MIFCNWNLFRILIFWLLWLFCFSVFIVWVLWLNWRIWSNMVWLSAFVRIFCCWLVILVIRFLVGMIMCLCCLMFRVIVFCFVWISRFWFVSWYVRLCVVWWFDGVWFVFCGLCFLYVFVCFVFEFDYVL